MPSNLILASQSPRRAELLTQIGVRFKQQPADVDETPFSDELPLEYVLRMAQEKALAVLNVQNEENSVVLGSDTIGEIDGKILVKPEDFDDFRKMMRSMSGRIHMVHTAIAVCYEGQALAQVVSAEVEFGALSDTDIDWYWNTKEPQDKAGGYAIQGFAGQFVKQIKGSYSAIVGLPLYETVQLLKQAGINVHEC